MADERAAYPGPRARAIIERMRRVEGAGPRTGAGEPLVVDHASGATLVDPDGNRYTDLAGSFAAQYNVQMAGAMMTALPTLIVFILLGRYFVQIGRAHV